MAVEATKNVTVPVTAAPVPPKKDEKDPKAAAGAPQPPVAGPPAPGAPEPKKPETAGVVGAGPAQATPTEAQGKKLYAMA